MTSCIFSFVKRCALTLQKLNGFVKLLHYLSNYKIFICLVSEWLGYSYYQFYKCNKYEPYHYFNHIKRLKTLLAFLCHIMNSPYNITCIIWKKNYNNKDNKIVFFLQYVHVVETTSKPQGKPPVFPKSHKRDSHFPKLMSDLKWRKKTTSIR